MSIEPLGYADLKFYTTTLKSRLPSELLTSLGGARNVLETIPPLIDTFQHPEIQKENGY